MLRAAEIALGIFITMVKCARIVLLPPDKISGISYIFNRKFHLLNKKRSAEERTR
ncbi:hypothetical protein CLOSYM_02831 [[Clostridium] symbiosum ATCC 14940]|uniref:Uncharacterized protein n=1 Tax=[Clostridium] symbiosum ATCC 14940 TaxID=411472 RepID=A0ABC9TWI9_CLOSY|nr:hypothetical protein CLOSYM_02831 [[Clostridium] symbiosum ATCC 14940]